MSKQKLLVVLGMHRSGTSAITRALQVFGANFGDRLMEADAHVNAKGFFEDEDIYCFNEQLLRAIGRHWHTLYRLQQVDFDRLIQEEFLLKAVGLLRKKMQGHDLYALKDPRISILLPFWQAVFEHCNLDVSYVVAIRHPMSVVASLSKRDHFEETKSYYLWLLYTLSSLSVVNTDSPLVVVDFDDFMHRPSYWLDKMASVFFLSIDENEKALYEQSFLDQKLIHTRFQVKDLLIARSCPPLISSCYQYLREYCLNTVSQIALRAAIQDWSIRLDDQVALLAFVDNLYIVRAQNELKHQQNRVLLSEQEQKLSEQEQKLSEQEQKLSEQEQKLSEQEQKLSEQKQNLEESEHSLSYLQESNELLEARLLAIHQTISWRITKPLRYLGHYARSVKGITKKGVDYYQRHGMLALIKRLTQKDSRVIPLVPSLSGNDFDISLPLEATFSVNRYQPVVESILLVAELRIEQCKKYRVTQKQEMLESLGCRVTVIDWHQSLTVLELIQTHSKVVFYRVPATDTVMEMIHEAHRLSIDTYWECDDLIFDPYLLSKSKSLTQSLTSQDMQGLLDAADSYARAMRACRFGIASTNVLAQSMILFGVDDAYIVENALDDATLSYAKDIVYKKQQQVKLDENISIFYGSGSKTHDIDFLEAAEALVDILKRFDHVTLKLAGPLTIPSILIPYEHKIERLPFSTYDVYLQRLGESDISIAPLEKSIFNDAKSNIKYLEASSVMVASVCSARNTFIQAIEQGTNGYLCYTKKDWYDAFCKLIQDKEHRDLIAFNAYNYVSNFYSPSYIADNQLKPILLNSKHSADRLLRVMVIKRDDGIEEKHKIIESNLSSLLEVYLFVIKKNSLARVSALRRLEKSGQILFSYFECASPAHDDVRLHQMLNSICSCSDFLGAKILHFVINSGEDLFFLDICRHLKISYYIEMDSKIFELNSDKVKGCRDVLTKAEGVLLVGEVVTEFNDNIFANVVLLDSRDELCSLWNKGKKDGE